MFPRIRNSQRAYFIDGPARGRTVIGDRSPSRLTWDDADGSAHEYRRVTHFNRASFYRHLG